MTVLLLRAAALASVVCCTAIAAGQAASPKSYHALRNVRVIDGDTLQADVVLGWDIVLEAREIRFAGFDAWETSRRRRTVVVTDEELVRGAAATAYLTELSRSGVLFVQEAPGKADPYGRLLCQPWLYDSGKGVWVDVLARMREAGHERTP